MVGLMRVAVALGMPPLELLEECLEKRRVVAAPKTRKAPK